MAYKNGLTVNFIDVGTGDCIFIRLPDGKNALIDVGQSTSLNYANIKTVLNAYSVKSVDYLILTHPDTDHIGNGLNMLNDYNVLKVFLPNVATRFNFSVYNQIKEIIEYKGIAYEYSQPFKKIIDEDYFIYFLSPIGANNVNDYYTDFNLSKSPNDEQQNNLSPIIYLEYKGVRFLFTGDAYASQERLLLYYYDAGIMQNFLPGLNLKNVDVLKVAHHGSKDSSCAEFLKLVSPKTAVISVGGNNSYGLPATDTINRLIEYGDNCEILRTDVHGTVSINVEEDGIYSIYKYSEQD